MKTSFLIYIPTLVTIVQQTTAQGFFSTIGAAVTGLVESQEEAKYSLISKGEGFEERQYPSYNWVCQTHSGEYSEVDQTTIFGTLLAYLDGENDQKATLSMSIPVSIEYKNTPQGKQYNACFYIEKSFQSKPPTPTNKVLSIIKRPSINVYTRQFGGYATSEPTWREESKALATIVEGAGLTIRNDTEYWNAYNSPLNFWNRRNEVWLVKA